jgi:hypothetical protein
VEKYLTAIRHGDVPAILSSGGYTV